MTKQETAALYQSLAKMLVQVRIEFSNQSEDDSAKYSQLVGHLTSFALTGAGLNTTLFQDVRRCNGPRCVNPIPDLKLSYNIQNKQFLPTTMVKIVT